MDKNTCSRSIPLYALEPGQTAVIECVLSRGDAKRRLTELGFFEGEAVQKVFVSPLGDPAAYLARGTLTALRKRSAAHIRVLPLDLSEV